MISTSDLPACPACGCRAVHAVQDPPRTFYACMQCGRDQTDAWKIVQPEKRPEPVSVIGKDGECDCVNDDNCAISTGPCRVQTKEASALGIAATVKS